MCSIPTLYTLFASCDVSMASCAARRPCVGQLPRSPLRSDETLTRVVRASLCNYISLHILNRYMARKSRLFHLTMCAWFCKQQKTFATIVDIVSQIDVACSCTRIDKDAP